MPHKNGRTSTLALYVLLQPCLRLNVAFLVVRSAVLVSPTCGGYFLRHLLPLPLPLLSATGAAVSMRPIGSAKTQHQMRCLRVPDAQRSVPVAAVCSLQANSS